MQEFTSDDDYTVWEPTNSALSQKQRFAPWAYGLPKLISVYDANGIKVKETQNVYNFNTSFFSKGCFPGERFYRNILLKKPLSKLSAKCLVKQNTSQNNTDWGNPAIYNDPNTYQKTSDGNILVDIYDLYTGRTELDTIYERVFKANNGYNLLKPLQLMFTPYPSVQVPLAPEYNAR